MFRLSPKRTEFLVLAVIALAVLLTVAVAVGVLALRGSEIRGDLSNNLVDMVTLLDQRIAARLDDQAKAAEIFATRPDVRALLSGRSDEAGRAGYRDALADTMQRMREITGERRIMLFDRQMNLVPPSGPSTLQPVEVQALHWALTPGQPLFVNLHPTAANDLVYGFAQPVHQDANPARPVVGAIYLEYDAADPIRFFLDAGLQHHGSLRVSMLRQDGGAIAALGLRGDRSVAAWSMPLDAPNAARSFEAQALRGADLGVIEGIDMRGVPVLGAAAPVIGSPWLLAVSLDRDEIEAPLNRQRSTVLIAGAALVLLLGVAGFYAWRRERMLRQVREDVLSTRYATAILTLPDGFLRVAASGAILEANAAAAEMTGYSVAQLGAMTLAALEVPGAVPDPTENWLADPAARGWALWQREDGRRIEVFMTRNRLQGADGEETCLFVRDVTAMIQARRRLERLNNLYRFNRHATSCVERLREPQAILAALVQGAKIDRHITALWVGWVDRAAGMVRPLAAAKDLEAAKKLGVTLDPAWPTSQGPTSRAVRERRIVTLDDMQTSAATAVWRATAKAWNVRAAAALPVIVRGEVVAVMTMYSDEADFFTGEILDLIGEMAATLSLGLEAADGRQNAQLLAAERLASQLRLEGILQAAPVPILVTSRSTHELRLANAAFADLFGAIAAHSDVSAWLDAACVDPTERAAFRGNRARTWDEFARTGRPAQVPPVQLRAADGSVRIMQGYVSLTGDDELLAWIDLTDLRQRESALHRREAIYAAIADQTDQIIALVDAETGEMIEFNEAAHKTLGYTREAFASTNVFALDARPPEEVARSLAQARASGGGMFRAPLRAADGTVREMTMHVRTLVLDGRRCLATIGADVTEQTRQASALADQAEMHRVLFEHAPDGIALIDEAGEVVEYNERLAEIMHLSKGAHLVSHVWDWGARFSDLAAWRQWMAMPLNKVTAMTRLRRLDGSEFDAESTMTMVNIGGRRFCYSLLREPTGAADGNKPAEGKEAGA